MVYVSIGLQRYINRSRVVSGLLLGAQRGLQDPLQEVVDEEGDHLLGELVLEVILVHPLAHEVRQADGGHLPGPDAVVVQQSRVFRRDVRHEQHAAILPSDPLQDLSVLQRLGVGAALWGEEEQLEMDVVSTVEHLARIAHRVGHDERQLLDQNPLQKSVLREIALVRGALSRVAVHHDPRKGGIHLLRHSTVRDQQTGEIHNVLQRVVQHSHIVVRGVVAVGHHYVCVGRNALAQLVNLGLDILLIRVVY